MSIHDIIRRRMKEFDRLYCQPRNYDNQEFRAFLLSLGQETKEPGAPLQVDIDMTDEEIDAIMHGRGPAEC